MAYLAALPKGPDNYHPIRSKAERQGSPQLDPGQDMAELGWVCQADADAAHGRGPGGPGRAAPRAGTATPTISRRGGAPARRRHPGPHASTKAASTCAPPWIPKLQTAARVALMHGLEKYDRRHGWRGAWGHVETLDAGWEKRGAEGQGRRRPSAAPGVRPSPPTGLGRRPPEVPLAEGGRGASPASDMAWANAGKGLKVGDLVFVEKPTGRRAPIACARCRSSTAPWWRWSPAPAAVVAMVGGYSLLAVELQPRHPGDAPAGLGLQAVRLRHGPGERLHAGQRRGRQRHHPARRQAGEVWSLENYHAASSTAP